MLTTIDIHLAAKRSLSNNSNWGNAVLTTLLYFILYSLCKAPYSIAEYLRLIGLDVSILLYISIPFYLLSIVFSWAYQILFLQMIREGDIRIENIFHGFRGFVRILGTMLLSIVYTILWTLLFIVPGFVKTFSYAMPPYILKDYPTLSYNAAIELSMKMMQGHKWRLCKLFFSFIGWLFLSFLTLGIGLVLLYPYVMSCLSIFYLEVKKAYEASEDTEPQVIASTI